MRPMQYNPEFWENTLAEASRFESAFGISLEAAVGFKTGEALRDSIITEIQGYVQNHSQTITDSLIEGIGRSLMRNILFHHEEYMQNPKIFLGGKIDSIFDQIAFEPNQIFDAEASRAVNKVLSGIEPGPSMRRKP